MDPSHQHSAERIHSQLATSGAPDPEHFRRALFEVPAGERDAWVDLALGLGPVPDDGPELPRGCVPYLPCSVGALLRVVEEAGVQESDVFVDVGAGVGRAAAAVHLLTGATTIGLEIQPALVEASRALKARLNVHRFAPVHGDATRLAGLITIGSVFFLYCPFSGERLEKVLADLELIARTRPIRVCCVDLPLPPCEWLERVSPLESDVHTYRSTVHPR